MGLSKTVLPIRTELRHPKQLSFQSIVRLIKAWFEQP
jgi:hypothetical protein